MEENVRSMGANENPLGFEPVKKLLFRFAVPAVVAILVNSLYNVVDQIFIGQGIGYLGNAATTGHLPGAQAVGHGYAGQQRTQRLADLALLLWY